jgi:hypothetical protein
MEGGIRYWRQRSFPRPFCIRSALPDEGVNHNTGKHLAGGNGVIRVGFLDGVCPQKLATLPIEKIDLYLCDLLNGNIRRLIISNACSTDGVVF